MKNKKMKLTYRNEITLILSESARQYFQGLGLFNDSDICIYCVRLFFNGVKCPTNLSFGGKITKDEPNLFECSIYEQTNGYAGKIIFVQPTFS